MKKNYFLSSAFLLSFLSITAQNTFEITTESGNVVANNDIYYYTTSSGESSEGHFDIKNISATTQTFTVRKYEDVINTVSPTDMAEASFCSGLNCYGPQVTSAAMILSPGQKILFKPSLIEASVTGLSQIRYKFANATNASEAITISLKYANTVSLAKNSFNLFSELSIFPNPASSKSALVLNASSELSQATISIVNSLGAQVMSKSADLSVGKNTIPLSLEGLSEGLYFVSITSNSATSTKKLIISK
jgi:hypothetical protein